MALEGTIQHGKGKVELTGAGAVAAARKKLLPQPRTKGAALEVAKQHGKGKANGANAGAIRQKPLPALTKISEIEARKQDTQARGNSAGVGEITAGGKQMPSLASKSKTPGIEIKKQNGKGKASPKLSGRAGKNYLDNLH